MQGSRTTEVIRPITFNTLGRDGEWASLVVWSPPLGVKGVQSNPDFGSSPFLGNSNYGITPHHDSDKNLALHLPWER